MSLDLYRTHNDWWCFGSHWTKSSLANWSRSTSFTYHAIWTEKWTRNAAGGPPM